MSRPSEPEHEPSPSNMTLSLMEQDRKVSSSDVNPVIQNTDGVSAEEYIREIFGDVGFLINGKLLLLNFYSHIITSCIHRFFLFDASRDSNARSYLSYQQIYFVLFQYYGD
jgi:hypothetical protein